MVRKKLIKLQRALLPPLEFFIGEIARDSLIREGGGGFVVGRIKSRVFYLEAA